MAMHTGVVFIVLANVELFEVELAFVPVGQYPIFGDANSTGPIQCCVCIRWPIFLRTKIKIALTRCHILRLKCTKIDFFWGSARDPAGGAYSAPPDPLAGFKGPYF